MIRLALFSHDDTLAPLLESALQNYCSVTCESRKDMLPSRIANGSAELLMLDFDSASAPLQEHLALYEELRAYGIPIIIMTDDLRRSTAIELLQRGAFECVRKPPSLLELKVVVQRAYEHHWLKVELERMRQMAQAAEGSKIRRMLHVVPAESGCAQMVGSSRHIQGVYDRIHRVVNLSAYVLITGESGTGKELVARAIHSLSDRAMQPFVAVSCGAIPETLIEAELFGHEKGAYTGSTGAAAGYLEQAGEGTLLLDEIGELSPQTQVKLLRVLQQKEFTRLGSTRPVPLKARVLFATHRDLEEMVDAGTFRRDLYFRVNVMRINVPPLRERTDDIPTLARHFLQRYCAMYGKDVADIRPNAMNALLEYDWPGNIRELENVIQGAIILADNDEITVSDLPEHLQHFELCTDEASGEPDSFGDQLRHYKVRLAQKTVVECNGNKSLAARKLGVSRAYLHRLIRMPAASGA